MRRIDFLPDRIRAQRARWRRLTIQGYLLAVCVAALGALAYVFHLRVLTAREELGILASRSDTVKRQLNLRGDLETQLADLMIKKRIEEQLGRRVGTLDVLGELQRLMPESMALSSLTMETVPVTVPVSGAAGMNQSNRAVPRGASKGERVIKRVRLLLTGMAPTDVDVANFIGQLAASPVFEDVNMGYAKNITLRSRNARKFQASCYVIR